MLSTEKGRNFGKMLTAAAGTKMTLKMFTMRLKAICALLLPNTAKLIPGVKETVEKLREMGLKIGSTTGYTSEMMQYVLPVAKEQGYEPDCCVTPDVTEYSRPTPFMVFECMRQLNVYPPKLVVKAGDTVMDILEGKNAGAWSVGIIKGSNVVGLNEADIMRLMNRQKKNCTKKQEKFILMPAQIM